MKYLLNWVTSSSLSFIGLIESKPVNLSMTRHETFIKRVVNRLTCLQMSLVRINCFIRYANGLTRQPIYQNFIS